MLTSCGVRESSLASTAKPLIRDRRCARSMTLDTFPRHETRTYSSSQLQYLLDVILYHESGIKEGNVMDEVGRSVHVNQPTNRKLRGVEYHRSDIQLKIDVCRTYKSKRIRIRDRST